MRYNSLIHGKADLIKSQMWKLLSWLPGMITSKSELLVLNYHGTPKSYKKNLETQLKFFLDQYRFISPVDLQDYFENKLDAGDGLYLLLNFDDGIKSIFKIGFQAFFGLRTPFPMEIQGLHTKNALRDDDA